MARGWLIGIGLLLLFTGLFVGSMWLLFPPKTVSDTTAQTQEQTFPKSTPTATVTQPYQPTTPPIQAPIPTDTPNGFAMAFYKWYLYQYANKLDNLQNPAFLQTLPQWLTPEFVAVYKDVSASPDEGDLILLANDWETSWPRYIQASVYSQTANSAEIIVTLGKGSQAHKIHLSLIKTDGGWRASNVSPTA